MDSDSHSILMLLLAIFLVLLNGFFVLSEFAIVKVRRSKLEELAKSGKSNAELALKISSSLDSYLSATQLGITLSSLALGWIGEPALAKLLEEPFKMFFEENTTLLHTISFLIAFTTITLAHVVFGELIPKSIAIAKSEKSTLIIAKPLYVFWVLFYPLIRLFDILASFFLRKMGIQNSSEQENAHSDEELKIIVTESYKSGLIDSVESEIIKNAVDFSDTIAKEIMTPRKDMICLNLHDSFEDNLKIVENTRYTRYPYHNGNKDNILGIVHIRDLLNNTLSSHPQSDISKLARPIIAVPENSPISDVLAQMNKERIHTALVIDEYGGTSGLVTMDDILEQIMGDISDEHDLEEEQVVKINETTFELDGMLNLEDAHEILQIPFDDSQEVVTVGGYVLNLFGRLPSVSDSVDDENYTYEILNMDGNRIKSVRATRIPLE